MDLQIFIESWRKMRVKLACVAASERRLRLDPAFGLTQEYLTRAALYEPCSIEIFATESALLASLDRRSGRSRSFALLLDGAGKSFSSSQFAAQLGSLRDSGQQQVIACVGPADGWSHLAQTRADLLISLGPMTLPHALAQLVLAEQIYRALTILAGHPYHCGH